MQEIMVSASFISLKEKAGNAKVSGKPYSFATLRALVEGEVLDMSIDLNSVDIKAVREIATHDKVELSLKLVPSGKGGYEALEPRVQVVGVEAL